MTLRTRADCERIAERAASTERVVVVGASFIGMESAASLKARGVSKVTVVAPERFPFEHTLGEAVGGVFRDLHESHGVELRLGRKVARIEGQQGVEAVILDDGDRLEAQLVVVGIGVEPATTGVRGVELENDGSIQVDELMRVCPGVYAAGDIATFPDWRTGEATRIEHWRTAQQQGMIAGRNLAGDVRPFRAVPFFWTMQFGVGLSYVGHATAWDDEIIHGSLAERDFLIFYLCDGRLLAGAGIGRDLQINALHELLQLGREPAVNALRSGELDLASLLDA
jgi:NADPH-dependent 2,4-dienoyl-CoA reductase/sulfur reductase-like enzyme